MLKKQQFGEILDHSGVAVEDLKQTQSHYLNTLGLMRDQRAYFEGRLKIGWVHAQVGVPISLYQSAYRVLQEVLVRQIWNSCDDPELARELTVFVIKIAQLDMSLAISAYHHSRVDMLEDSLRDMRTEQRQLMVKANTDELTGLPMRDVVVQQLARDLMDADDMDGSVHLIMADLDHFKQVNDQYGHLVGDTVLQGVAARIRQSLRGSDMVGRYGGEEFIILLKNKTLRQAQRIAERIRQHVESSPVKANEHVINITLSQGLAEGAMGDDTDSIIGRADEALYAAKHQGRNCVVTAETDSGH
jgi:diguanylate cyclase (GGDEF)-like protein